MRLSEKTVLITGGARRIGRSLTLALARECADVIIHHNQSPSEAETLRDQVQELGGKASIYQCDFSSPEATHQFAENLFKSTEVQAIVNNASIFSDLNWETTSADDWTRHQRINLLAPFLLSKTFAQNLPSNAKGRIVNLLDWRALRPGPDHLPYTISKAGLASLTRSLAISLAPQVTVNGIALGAVLPPSDGGDTEDLVSYLPIPRWAELSEVEETLIFLLSGPEYITGEIIHLDGGRHLI